MRHAVYCGTRRVYPCMETAAKSLVANSWVDRVHFLIEDPEFPTPLPGIIECHDVSGQKWFPGNGPNAQSRWTWMVLMRAALCHVLPDVDVVLSLDVDTIVHGDIGDIWELPIDDCYFAAVTEQFKSENGLQYTNFGVALMNLAKLRDGKADEIIEVLNRRRYPWPEQDVFNYLCQGRICEMPKEYNDMAFNGPVANPLVTHYAGQPNSSWVTEREPTRYREMGWDEAMGMHASGAVSGKKVLFSSDRPLERAENLKAVWDAYQGPKRFMQYIPRACDALSPEYSVFVTDCTPQWSATKGDVKTLFVSHGVSGDKLYGLNFSEEGHRRGCSQVDHAICTTPYTQRNVMGEVGLPADRVHMLGFPLHDRYFGKRKGDGGTVLSAFRRAYLYVPTWRTSNDPPLPRIDWEKIDALMDDDEILVVKRHMCTRGTLVGKKLARVKEYGNALPSAPFVIDCDVLATDFSSIMFDAYAMSKPVVLVADGAAEYNASQGLYEDYPSWYGSRSVEAEGNEERLLELLRDAWRDGMGEADRRCADTVVGEIDGRAAERVAGLIGRLASDND